MRALLLLALSMIVRADTLTLRDGTVLTGSWAGISGGKISFLSNGQLREFSKSDVLQVTFGEESSPPQTRPPQATDATSPITIRPGQTIAEVTAILGQPKTIADNGAVKVYVYPNLKITFTNGKVTNAE
jgi:hypothetical protein